MGIEPPDVADHAALPRPSYPTMILRALRLRCPRCGEGRLYRGWFRMFGKCDHCHLLFEREPGFYLGSIYVNYFATAVLTTILYFAGYGRGVPNNWLLASLLVFCLVFPLLMFRHARAIWLAFDQFWDPQETGEASVDAEETTR